MLKILQARLQQYVNSELSDVQARLRKSRGTRDQIANTHWLIDKAREFQKKTSTSAPLTMTKQQICPTNCGHSLGDGNARPPDLPPEKSVCRSRATVRTRRGTTGWFQIRKFRTRNGTDWFPIRKGVCQSCILSPCLFQLYAEYIMQNVGLDEAQARIKIAGRNINNLRYADDTTLMAESEEELESLLIRGEWRVKKLA